VAIPEQGKGILYIDDTKLFEVRQQHMTISMDGAGGLREGEHRVRVDVVDHATGGIVAVKSVVFRKEGAPEDTAGPFHDERFDGDDLIEVGQVSHADAMRS
jgi:hypothetical protein